MFIETLQKRDRYSVLIMRDINYKLKYFKWKFEEY